MKTRSARAGAAGWIVVALAAAARPPAARAQDIPPPAVALVGGALQYDLSGTGTVPFVSLRLDLPMTSWLYVEPSFGTMRYTSQGGAHVRHLAAEVQLQGTVPLGRWHPYAGVGAGGFLDLRKQRGGADFVEPTLSGSGGLRITLPWGLGARAELRARGIGKSLGGSTVEWGAGISKTF